MKGFTFAGMLIVFILCLASISVSAQVSKLGFNYQGVYRDNNGVIQKNKSVTVNFIIYKGAVSSGNVVYSESQSATTDNFGVFSLVIGAGTPTVTGKFSDIDWSASSAFYIKTQIVISGTPTDIATTQLMAVPFAKSASTTDMISGQAARNGSVLIYDSLGGQYKPFLLSTVPFALVSGTTLIIDSKNARNGNVLVYDSISKRYVPVKLTSVTYAEVSGTTNIINNKNARNKNVLVYDSISGQYKPVKLDSVLYAGSSGTTKIINTKGIKNGNLLAWDSVNAQFKPLANTIPVIDTKNMRNGDLLTYDSLNNKFVAYANPWSNYAILEERNSAGVNEGANVSGWQVRTLNTTVQSEGSSISLNTGTNQFTLAPGKYYIDGYVTSTGYNARITSQVFNATDNVSAILGSSSFTTTASSALDNTRSFVQGIITVNGTGSKKFELQMYSDVVNAYVGLGSSTNATSYKGASTYKPEVYCHLFIQKVK